MSDDKQRIDKIISTMDAYERCPSIELFDILVSLVSKDDFRAGVSKVENRLPASNLLYLAFLKNGYKPLVWIYNDHFVEKYHIIYKDMNFFHLEHDGKYCKKEIIVYNNENLANQFISLRKSKLCFPHPKIDYEFGKLLGYPEEDIHFFIERNLKRKSYSIPLQLINEIKNYKRI